MRVSFTEALVRTKEALLRKPIQEVEQLMMAAFFRATGKSLSRLDLYSRNEEDFPGKALEILDELAYQRALGRPLQHITGKQFFLENEYDVSDAVLIPRPETEGLVATASEILAKESEKPLLGLEVGLGSGVISTELLSRFPKLKMMASEFSKAALKVGVQNASLILGGDVRVLNGEMLVEVQPAAGNGAEDHFSDWRLKVLLAPNSRDVLEPFQKSGLKADFIITNPPYLVPSDEIDSEVIQSEPHEALFAPSDDSLYFYRRIASDASSILKITGFVFAEVPHERASEIFNLFSEDNGWESRLLPDLSGRDRVLVGQFMGVCKGSMIDG